LFRSVNVLPVGGLTLSDGDKPLCLGKAVVVGPLAEATVAAVSQLSRDEVGVWLALSYDAWWAEDLLEFRSDPAAYNHVLPAGYRSLRSQSTPSEQWQQSERDRWWKPSSAPSGWSRSAG
jgi:hypothetical protein